MDDAREEALKELAPSSEDFYYFTCLHYQLKGDKAAFHKTLNDWVRARNGRWNNRMKEMRRRQALLDFETRPQTTWDFLTKTEPAAFFNHRPRVQKANNNAPSAVKDSFYNVSAYLTEARRNGFVSGFTDSGIEFVLSQKLSPRERRNALNRLTRADIDGLVDLIADDLAWNDLNGRMTVFGGMRIHGLLSLDQLNALLKKKPMLLDNDRFVAEVLIRMRPNEETDLANDLNAAQAYYQSLYEWVSKLPSKHASLKASVLYSLLDVNRKLGQYDEKLFLEYLSYPRRVHYVEHKLRDDWNRRRVHQVNFNYGGAHGFQIPRIGNEQPLVMDYLAKLLIDKEGVPAEYARLFYRPWLDSTFARIKILAGKDPDGRWARKLSAGEFKALKDRVDVDFVIQNPRQFYPGDAVKLDVDVKNVPQLLVKVYEIQTFNYYKNY